MWMGESGLALEGSGVWERLESSASQLQGEADIACHPAPVSDALVFSQGLPFWERVEGGGSRSPQGNEGGPVSRTVSAAAPAGGRTPATPLLASTSFSRPVSWAQ